MWEDRVPIYGDDHVPKSRSQEESAGFSDRTLFEPGSPVKEDRVLQSAVEELANRKIPFTVKRMTT